MNYPQQPAPTLQKALAQKQSQLTNRWDQLKQELDEDIARGFAFVDILNEPVEFESCLIDVQELLGKSYVFTAPKKRAYEGLTYDMLDNVFKPIPPRPLGTALLTNEAGMQAFDNAMRQHALGMSSITLNSLFLSALE